MILDDEDPFPIIWIDDPISSKDVTGRIYIISHKFSDTLFSLCHNPEFSGTPIIVIPDCLEELIPETVKKVINLVTVCPRTLTRLPTNNDNETEMNEDVLTISYHRCNEEDSSLTHALILSNIRGNDKNPRTKVVLYTLCLCDKVTQDITVWLHEIGLERPELLITDVSYLSAIERRYQEKTSLLSYLRKEIEMYVMKETLRRRPINIILILPPIPGDERITEMFEDIKRKITANNINIIITTKEYDFQKQLEYKTPSSCNSYTKKKLDEKIGEYQNEKMSSLFVRVIIPQYLPVSTATSSSLEFSLIGFDKYETNVTPTISIISDTISQITLYWMFAPTATEIHQAVERIKPLKITSISLCSTDVPKLHRIELNQQERRDLTRRLFRLAMLSNSAELNPKRNPSAPIITPRGINPQNVVDKFVPGNSGFVVMFSDDEYYKLTSMI